MRCALEYPWLQSQSRRFLLAFAIGQLINLEEAYESRQTTWTVDCCLLRPYNTIALKMAFVNPKHINLQDGPLCFVLAIVPALANFRCSFELFLLGEGEKKIEEKVYSGTSFSKMLVFRSSRVP